MERNVQSSQLSYLVMPCQAAGPEIDSFDSMYCKDLHDDVDVKTFSDVRHGSRSPSFSLSVTANEKVPHIKRPFSVVVNVRKGTRPHYQHCQQHCPHSVFPSQRIKQLNKFVFSRTMALSKGGRLKQEQKSIMLLVTLLLFVPLVS